MWALKIAAIEYQQTEDDTILATITPTEIEYDPFIVDEVYLNTNKPEVGGYYVVYSGGHKAFWFAKLFDVHWSKV